MKKSVFCLFVAVGLVLSASLLAWGISADKIIRNVRDAYEKQMKDVEDFTIITNRHTLYQKRAVIEGKTVYKNRFEMDMAGFKIVTVYDGIHQWSKSPVSGKVEKAKLDYSPFQIVDKLKSARAEYTGTEKIDGYKAYVLNIEDMAELMGAAKPKELAGKKISGKLWIDAKDWVVRKMETDIEGLKTIIKNEDFRRVKSMLIAHRSIMTSSGGGTTGLSPEQEQEMRDGLENMEMQLKSMSPGQREMAEKMMNPQMERMRSALAGKGQEEVTIVKEAKVNTGLSDALFDGTRL